MRINKSPDSPLNESQFSDHPILNSNPVLFRSVCYYHPDQTITNFCRSTGCLLPLCPECVKLHATSHRSQGTHGEFDTIENTVKELYQDLAQHEINFRENEVNFKDFLKTTAEYNNLMMSKLQNARARILEFVESYFSTLALDVEKRVALQVQRAQSEVQNGLAKLRDRQEKVKEFMGNLRTPKVLKTAIHLLSSPFSSEQLALFREQQSLHKLLISERLDIVPDENSLHSINLNLSKYITVHNSERYKPEEMRAPVISQKILTNSAAPNVMRSNSPTVFLTTTMKAPQQQQPNPQIIYQNPQQVPLQVSNIMPQSKSVVIKQAGVSQIIMQKPQESKTFHVAAPQSRPPEMKNSSSLQASKVHRVHPSIPGDPVFIDLNNNATNSNPSGNSINKKEYYENIPAAQTLVRVNPKYVITQSPTPVRVRSVSPPQMMRVVNNGASYSNSKMNMVYLGADDRRRDVMYESQGIRTSSKPKKK